MDIKNINQNLVNNRLNDSANNSPKGNAASTPSGTPKSTDKVTLTDVSSQVSNLEKQAAASSIDNSARIEELREAIKDGTYQVDAEKVANKLIQTEALLAGS